MNMLSRAAILIAISLVAYFFVLPFAWQAGGVETVVASGAALGLCLAGATLALVFSEVIGGYMAMHLAVYAGMLFRMFIPLFLGALFHFSNPMLAEGGLLYYLAGFYFVTLAAEIALTLPLPSPMTTVERK